MSRVRSWGPTVACGALFCVVFWYRYGAIPSEFFAVRDDGIITQSHARSVVEVGTIGVSASGERVEGFLSPVQWLAFVLLYALWGVSYPTGALLQTWACTFLLGSLVYRLLTEESHEILLPALLCAALAFYLTGLYAFFEWHGSGMENAVTHWLLLAAVLVLARASRAWRASMLGAVVLCAAALSRTEAIVHVAPLLLLFAVADLWFRRRATGVALAVLTLALWLVATGLRYAYFGDWRPNTAYAQGIDPVARLQALATGDWGLWRQSLRLGLMQVRAHGLWLAAASLPLAVVSWRRNGSLTPWLLLSQCFTSVASPFLFGYPRLDPVRPSTYAAIAACLLPAVLLVGLRSTGARLMALAAFGLVASWVAWARVPYRLCCGTSGFERIRTEFGSLATTHPLFRPTVANPDLGAMSWYKEFNIVDLGELGSPVLARLAREDDVVNYLFLVGAPDLIEAHEYWCDRYRYVFDHPSFSRFFEAARETFADGRRLAGMWVRRDIMQGRPSRERLFLDRLAQRVEVADFEQELRACVPAGAVTTCLYVTRAAYRYLPELEARGALPRLRAAFAASPSGRYDHAVLSSRERGDWYRDVVAFLAEHRTALSGEASLAPAL